MAAHHVYVIKSISHNYIYVGITDNPDRRIHAHNQGYSRTTKPYRPFRVILTEVFASRPEARKREFELKTGAGKAFLRKLAHETESRD